MHCRQHFEPDVRFEDWTLPCAMGSGKPKSKVVRDWGWSEITGITTKKRIWDSRGILKITHFKRLFGGWEMDFENENKPVIWNWLRFHLAIFGQTLHSMDHLAINALSPHYRIIFGFFVLFYGSNIGIKHTIRLSSCTPELQSGAQALHPSHLSSLQKHHTFMRCSVSDYWTFWQ